MSDWAKKQGISYKAAWRWFKEGKLPVPAYQSPSGTIKEDEIKSHKVAIYARVSSTDQRADLDRQVKRLKEFASNRGLIVSEVVTEIGSGLNGKRKKFIKLLSDKSIDTIIVEHRDRATRFGFEYIEATLKSSGRRMIVVDETELNNDLVQDMSNLFLCLSLRETFG